MDAYKFFEMAYVKVILRFERGYSNDPDDNGGETYYGISRVNHPKWPGWEIIDLAKKSQNFPKNLEANDGLQQLVRGFFKENYWDTFRGDELPYEIAEELLDISDNCGVHQATEYLQRTLNVLNKNQSLYPDLPVDGQFGPQTFKTLKICIDKSFIRLFNVLNMYQGKHYIESMERNHNWEKYVGWFDRIDIAKL